LLAPPTPTTGEDLAAVSGLLALEEAMLAHASPPLEFAEHREIWSAESLQSAAEVVKKEKTIYGVSLVPN